MKPVNTIKALNSEIAELSKEWYTQFGLSQTSQGSSGKHELKSISLSFNSYGEQSVELSRRMVVDRANELLVRLNSNPDIRVQLHSYPMTTKSLMLSFYFHAADGEFASPPHIACADVAFGKVSYAISEKTVGPFKKIHQETFEEACRIVEETKKKE